MNADQHERLAEQLRDAFEHQQALRIRGGGSKAFCGRAVQGVALDVRGHCGIVEYQPTELVITARAGTPLLDVQAALAEAGQMLPFEPPQFSPDATLGGVIACGLSGPRRPFTGAARDVVLGVGMVNGRGEVLRFGGQVMKNVAGYDISRLMTGAQGTLGLLLDVSLKVLPTPVCERSLRADMDVADAIVAMNRLAGRPLPLSATAFDGEVLWLRLSGAEPAVAEAMEALCGEIFVEVEELTGQQFWRDLRERQHRFFSGDDELWRLSLPAASPALDLPGRTFYDWGGAQRWLKTNAEAGAVHVAINKVGGHATRFTSDGAVAQPLSPALAALHQRLKQAFDPVGILNPGRLYEGL
ncbi:MAG: glycolate oxidase subunit GlcE [Gammaproteobacteria bacterium]|nr:glycolate oxidase subunit GlcE [Gammaproteobacteria bacterium]